MMSGRLSVRLVAPAAAYWSFVPLLEIAGLAAVWPWRRSPASFAQGVDEFFANHTPWSLWLCGLGAVWAFFPTPQVYSWTEHSWAWYGSALLAGTWSAWLDYGFLRKRAARTPAAACRDIAVQRLITWSVGLAWFLGPAGWQVVASRWGL
jgi:hypothetical protein